MHGTEHRIMKRRTRSLLTPRQPFSPAPASSRGWRAACIFITGPFTRAEVFLARNDFRLREFRSGVHGPPLALRSLTNRLILLVRPFSSATSRRFAPAAGGIHASDPLHSCRFVLQAARPISTPPTGVFAPSGSKRSTGYPAFRSAFRTRPIFVRSPQPPISIWLRIIVPDPLRFRRLAVPQTSWNLPHYATKPLHGQ